jgi:hypothetical protein
MIQLIDSNRHLQGEYKETIIDLRKKESPFLLTSIIGKYYNVWDNTNKKNIEIVGRRNFDKWASQNEYLTDF